MQTVMFLSDAKVYRLTRGNGHLGMPVPGTMIRVTVGVKWSLPKKKTIPDEDVLVRPRYSLKRLGKNKYQIDVPDRYAERTMFHLLDHCCVTLEVK